MREAIDILGIESWLVAGLGLTLFKFGLACWNICTLGISLIYRL